MQGLPDVYYLFYISKYRSPAPVSSSALKVFGLQTSSEETLPRLANPHLHSVAA